MILNNVVSPADKYDLSEIKRVCVGSSSDNDIIIAHGDVSLLHCEFVQEGGAWKLINRSQNGIHVNNVKVASEYTLRIGDIIDFSVLKIVFCGKFIGIMSSEDNSYVVREGLRQLDCCKPLSFCDKREKTYFHRSPRITKIPTMEHISIEAPPTKQKIERKPLLLVIGPTFTMMIPMLIGGVLAMYSYRSSGTSSGVLMYTGIISAVASAVIGVIWAFVNIHYDKKKYIIMEEERKSSYIKYIRRQITKLKSVEHEMVESWLEMYKSPDYILDYSDKSPELWNRNRQQDDFLMQRLGIGSINVKEHITVPPERYEQQDDILYQLPCKVRDEFSNVKNIPVGVDIGKEGIIGIVGDGDKSKAYDIARIIITQIAANNCYRDVKMAFIYDSDKDGNEWNEYRFMPHVWSDDYENRFVASNRFEADDLLFELINILREREERVYGGEEKAYTHIVLFISDISLIEGHPINKYISNDAMKYQFTVITLADNKSSLLNDTTYELIYSGDFTGCHRMKTDEWAEINFDVASKTRLKRFVERIATIKVNEDVATGGLPDSLTFFEMMGISKPCDLDSLTRWRNNKNYNSMRAVIGRCAGGKECVLDVHEKYHGPHGLVAGTTGSGKSETLQTYILSMAVNYSPDDVGFFIIDYKGGGMANLFEGLPHMIGAISNLSGSAIKRAMVSIKSENQRRQRVFADAGVNNINNYTKLVKTGQVDMPVPHLFIIVDEFAELKREQPEFMKELISVAQVGRSLGVHLILSTQKPAGTVDDNIWSNSKFKLCLRVQDKQDSKEMLHKDDAAYITQAGRGYLQVGNDELYELFQSGWSGAEYCEDENKKMDTQTALLSSMGGVAYKIKHEKKSYTTQSITELDAVKEYLAIVAANSGYNRDYSLWIPPLSNPIYIEDIDELSPADDDKADCRIIAYLGMYDDPSRQSQKPYIIDVVASGNIAVCGMNVSGKSTFLQTFIASLISRYTAEDINIYIADYSNKSLNCFCGAPQVGGFVTEDDAEKTRKLIFLINRIIAYRKKTLGGITFSAYKRTHKDIMPAVLFVIDNYSGFREKTSELYDDDMVRITHDGASYGVYTIITANDFSNAGIPSRVESNMGTTVSLVMSEKYMYSSVLRTGRIEIEPENLKGRGLIKVGGEILEFQTALSQGEADDIKRMEKLRVLCQSMADETTVYAEPIPEIPSKPTWEIFKSRRDVKEMCMDSFLPLGYDSESADGYGIDLRRTFCYMISGRTRTGKKNTMRLLMQAACIRNADVVVIEHATSNFKTDAEDVDAKYINSEEKQAEYFSNLVPQFVERNKYKNMLREQGYDDGELYDHMTKFKETYIFISDMREFINTLYYPKEGITRISPFVENIAEKGSLHNIYIIGILDIGKLAEIRGTRVYEAMTGYHVGVQLGGNCSEAGYFNFSNLSYAEQNTPYKPGVGMISRDNDDRGISKIVIPQYKRLVRYD